MRGAKRYARTIRSVQSIMTAKRPLCPFHARMQVMSEAHRRFGSATRACPSCHGPYPALDRRPVASQPRQRVETLERKLLN